MTDHIQLAAYLARIGHTGPLQPDLATLSALHAAHVAAIPFENLDPLAGRPVIIDLAHLQTKIVDSRRGGFCFEQNTLFKAVLEAIGFSVTGLGARVRWNTPADSPIPSRAHMALLVDLPEGPHLADVGFGACVLDAPLRLRTDIEQRTPMGTYRLREERGLLALDAMQRGEWRTGYMFSLEPQFPSDYAMASYFAATHPKSFFPTMLIMERVGGGARHKLIDRRYVVEARDGETVSETVLASPDELARMLDDIFNVATPVPAEALFPRLSA